MHRVCFGALVIPGTDCHVTIAVNKHASNIDITRIQQDLERAIRPHLPIVLHIGNYCKMGADGTKDAYRILFDDPVVEKLIKRFYREHYRGQPGKRLFPDLEPHVTVDTPEKLHAIERLVHEYKGVVKVVDTDFKTHTEGQPDTSTANEMPLLEPTFVYQAAHPSTSSAPAATSAPLARTMTPSVWKCPECYHINPIGRRECSGYDCDQWRPAHLRPQSARRSGDWMCCNTVQFASRASCFKCGKPKTSSSGGPTSTTQTSNGQKRAIEPAYTQPPFNPASASVSTPTRPRRGSWDCPGCGDHQFSRNTTCRLCGTSRS